MPRIDRDLDELGGLEVKPPPRTIQACEPLMVSAERGEDGEREQHVTAVEHRNGAAQAAVAKPDGADRQRDPDAEVEWRAGPGSTAGRPG